MGIREYKPVTPGRRGGSVSDFSEITDRKKKPEKSLLRPKPNKGGRNNQGIICTRFRGGGAKRKYRVIDFKRRKDGVWEARARSEEHTSELQSPDHLVCRLLLEKKNSRQRI